MLILLKALSELKKKKSSLYGRSKKVAVNLIEIFLFLVSLDFASENSLKTTIVRKFW